MTDEYFMQDAIRQAVKAYEADEVPVGAVVVRNGTVIARAWNQVELLNDATAHAEMLALTQAESVVGDWRLTDCDLYVSKEPCPMCAGAIAEARLAKLFYGASDIKGGAVDNGVALFHQKSCHHAPDIIGGLRERECADLLKGFFALRRNG